MAKNKPKRLSKIANEFNLGISTIVDFLAGKDIEVESNPNAKIEPEIYEILVGEFSSDKAAKEKSQTIGVEKVVRETISLDDNVKKSIPKREIIQEEIVIKNIENVVSHETHVVREEVLAPEEPVVPVVSDPVIERQIDLDHKEGDPRVIGKIDLASLNLKTRPSKAKKEEPKKVEPKKEEPKKQQPKEVKSKAASSVPEHIETVIEKKTGPTVLGKIVLPVVKPKKDKKKPVASSSGDTDASKKKRKRLSSGAVDKKDFGKQGGKPGANRGPNKGPNRGKPGKREPRAELTPEQIQQQVKDTLARLSGGGKNKGAKLRRAKREDHQTQREQEQLLQEAEENVLKVTEFVTANELATMMNTSVNDVISACMSLGLFVSINQRLDAETISIVAEEFGCTVEFISAEVQESIEVEEDKEEDLVERPPIVTVMGHVDHGKTSLLDNIRSENVIAGEAGGITQHIGAYSVKLGKSGKKITFLDTPGHEAFTAMRARGAQVTDIAIIIVAADDDVMPQTKEAINHAQAAGVPMVFAINKIDKDGANPDKVREQLSAMNILVEEWGGKYQCQEISAKKGTNVFDLLEKVLLEAEMLELKANPNKSALGTVIESELDKGRGYVSTVLVESGTMRVGDYILAGSFTGKVKAMHNERGELIKEAGPSTPVSLLGIPGAPSAGEKFNIMKDEKEAKAIATKRDTLQREQGVRTQKHVTLDEIGRRLALGEFKELNLIIKGDVDGSTEALADSLLKLSTDKVQINIIHKAVGQISESDVILASASDAIILGFQVRPSTQARKAAENEQIDIRLYSIIYDAVKEIKAAMEGMLDAKIVEKIICNVEVRDTFKITNVGTVAGCYVLDGKINRNTKIRLIRDGIVVYSGGLGSLKRFKDDVKEVTHGYECGLNIDKYNNIEVGDVIEGYEEVEVAQKL